VWSEGQLTDHWSLWISSFIIMECHCY
jgi:hypothetical protein